MMIAVLFWDWCGVIYDIWYSIANLYINRALEWFGVGMHLPFHIFTVGIISLVIVALHAGRYLLLSIPLLGLYALVIIEKIATWWVPEYPQLQGLPGPILHIEEMTTMDLPELNQVISYQLSHQQPITSFPVFPTYLARQEGLLRLEKATRDGLTIEVLQELGYRSITFPKGHQLAKELEGCCHRMEENDLWIYELPQL